MDGTNIMQKCQMNSQCLMSGLYKERLQGSTGHCSAKMCPIFYWPEHPLWNESLTYPLVWAICCELPSKEILGWGKKELIIDWSIVQLAKSDGH